MPLFRPHQLEREKKTQKGEKGLRSHQLLRGKVNTCTLPIPTLLYSISFYTLLLLLFYFIFILTDYYSTDLSLTHSLTHSVNYYYYLSYC